MAWELVLVLASVLVFRGAWLLLDRVEWLSTPAALWASVGAGLVATGVALRAIQRGE